MAQFGWQNCPSPVRAQVNEFLERTRGLLGDELIGMYLHGSLAMGCFNPEHSDIDLLAVTRHGMPVDIKRAMIKELLRRSGDPAPIEISFLQESDLHPWQYPTPFDLHYSETWRTQYQQQLEDGTWRTWNEKRHTDADLAAHITVVLHRGLCLYGSPIAKVFPPVPREHYIASLLEDFEWASEQASENPTYLILNSARIYRYLLDGQILSKDEAGAWAEIMLPPPYTEIMHQALLLYRSRHEHASIDPKALDDFVVYMRELIQGLASLA
ncbi:MAG: DUF4111 domain-containing protein [Anaerolineae bacterium]|nr:DUF4111 domain-containing protein [Anaerolineae bacterium]